MSDNPLLFEVTTPLSFKVRCTEQYWTLISTIKHDAIKEQLEEIKQTLRDPDEVRISSRDNDVYLFYRAAQKPKRWTCVVVRRLNGEGFLIPSYPTSQIKRGSEIWKK